MVGKWIAPWPGERVVAVVAAIEGDHLVCATIDGFRFEVPLVEAHKLIVGPTRAAVYGIMNGHGGGYMGPRRPQVAA